MAGASVLVAALTSRRAGAVSDDQPAINTRDLLANLPLNKWTVVHQQRAGDDVIFLRQSHGGSAFDSRRGRMVLFGSDTHGRDWSNAPLIFDLESLRWLRPYESDAPQTYKVDNRGLPVAGRDGDHPWAMHTFGAVVYHSAADRVFVCSYPAHLEPGRFTNVLGPVWQRIKRHPTWIFDPQTATWDPRPGEAVHFFAHAAAYDSHRNVIVGCRHDGIFELGFESSPWMRVAGGTGSNYGENMVYDSRNRAFVILGDTPESDEVRVYEPGANKVRIQATPGVRPPAGSYLPATYDPDLGVSVVLVARKHDEAKSSLRDMSTETWAYDLAADEWRNISSATLPFGLGMNYNMEYAQGYGVHLLVADPPGKPPEVWALKPTA